MMKERIRNYDRYDKLQEAGKESKVMFLKWLVMVRLTHIVACYQVRA